MLEILIAIAVALGGGGALALSDSTNKYEVARSEYDRSLEESESHRNDLQLALEGLGERILSTQIELMRAHRILEPLSRRRPKFSFRPTEPVSPTQVAALVSLTNYGNELVAIGGVGVGAGALIAAGSWTAVSMLGTASTGTAISSLHGVALTNATLASLGHGALAYGGGGVLAGKLFLAKIICLPAAFLMGVAAFKQASKCDEATKEVQEANKTNREVVAKIKQLMQEVAPLESKLTTETEFLVSVLDEVSAELLPLGFLNRMWRWLRYQLRGYYYTHEEMEHVDRLANAVNRFIATFKGSRVDSSSRDSGERRHAILSLT
jgi:hypothetical protein